MIGASFGSVLEIQRTKELISAPTEVYCIVLSAPMKTEGFRDMAGCCWCCEREVSKDSIPDKIIIVVVVKKRLWDIKKIFLGG